MKEYFFDTVFSFGKHENKTLEEVFKFDNTYIEWCLKNLAHFYVSEETLLELQKSNPNVAYQMSDETREFLRRKDLEYRDETESQYDEDPYDNYSLDDSYFDGGGGDEWSDPSQFWGD